MTTLTMTVETSRKVYLPIGDRAACECCGKKTSYKLCDRISVGLGGYFSNCRPLCKRCHKRIEKAAKGDKR